MKSLMKLIKQNKIWVFASVFITFVSIGVQLIWTLNIGDLADKIVERKGIDISFLVTMGLILIANGGLQYVNQIVNRYTSEKMAHTLRMNYADAILTKKQSGSSMGGYEAVSKVQNEVMASSEYMSNTLFNIVGMTLSGVFALFFLLFQNALLTVVILIPMIIVTVVTNQIGKKMVSLSHEALDKKEEHNKTAYGLINNFDVVLLFDAMPFLNEKYDENLDKWAKAEVKKERVSAVCNSITGVLSQIPLLILLIAGSILIWKGQMTIGTLMIFLNMIKSLLGTLMNLASWLVSVKNFLVNLKRADIAESAATDF